MTFDPDKIAATIASMDPAIPTVSTIDGEVLAGRMVEAANLSLVRLVRVALLTFDEAGESLTPIVGDVDAPAVARALREATATLNRIGDARPDVLLGAHDALEAVLQYMAVEAGVVMEDLSPEGRTAALMLAAGSVGQTSALLWGLRLDLFRDPGASAKIKSEAGKASGEARRDRWQADGATRAVELATAHPQWSVTDISSRIWNELAGKPYRPLTPKGVRTALDRMAKEGLLIWPEGSRPAKRAA